MSCKKFPSNISWKQRKAELIDSMRVGVDLGGSKIEIVVLDDSGRSLLRERSPSPRGNYAATLNAITELVYMAQQRLTQGSAKQSSSVIDRVGIAMPGAVSNKTGRVKNANSTWLIGKDLRGDLNQRLQCQVVVENDANCFVVSEASDGAAMNADSVFGVIIGTGTGAGIWVNGQLLKGANAIAGEWGHNPLPWPQADELPGPACYCGKSGCIETWLSGPGFSNTYLALSGERRDARQIYQLALDGNEQAEMCLRQYEDRLARSLATVINILDPDVVVLGGGMSNIERLYHNVPHLWEQYVFSDQVQTRLVAAKHGDSSGVRGAAWL